MRGEAPFLSCIADPHVRHGFMWLKRGEHGNRLYDHDCYHIHIHLFFLVH